MEVYDAEVEQASDAEVENATADASASGLLRATLAEFRRKDLSDRAATLTYYGLLSLFPALIALVSLVGLFANPVAATDKITEIVNRIGPHSTAATFAEPIRSITSSRSAAGILFVAGLMLALWSASAYVAAFARAANAIHDVREDRPSWRLKPVQLLLTLAIVALVAVLAASLALTGPVVDSLAGPLGVSSTATTIWDIAKWPAVLAVLITVIAVLYSATPNAKGGFRWITPGAAVAISAWLVASAMFAFYVASFGAYDKTYGTLGGVVVLLVWLWITNVALLFGLQLDVERKRSDEARTRELHARLESSWERETSLPG